MTATVLAFSGQIKSGKTTVSQAVAEALGCGRASFGDEVRKAVQSMGLPIEREHLQRIGEAFVSTRLEQFCLDVLAQVESNSTSHQIVDGVRHVEAADCLKRLVAPKQFRLIYVDTDESIREHRHLETSPTKTPLKMYDHHSTEVQVANQLKESADLVVNGLEPLPAIVLRIVSLIESSC
jgi:dephospho-CoA kinase